MNPDSPTIPNRGCKIKEKKGKGKKKKIQNKDPNISDTMHQENISPIDVEEDFNKEIEQTLNKIRSHSYNDETYQSSATQDIDHDIDTQNNSHKSKKTSQIAKDYLIKEIKSRPSKQSKETSKKMRGRKQTNQNSSPDEENMKDYLREVESEISDLQCNKPLQENEITENAKKLLPVEPGGGHHSKSFTTPPPSPETSTNNKDLDLIDRLEDAKFKKDNQGTIRIWNGILEILKNFVIQKTDLKLELITTGSYYDKTQVLQAVEFDVLMCFSSRKIKVSYYPQNDIPNASLCCLLSSYKDVNFLGSKVDKQGKRCLTPRLFYSNFKEWITEFVQEQKILLKKLKKHVELSFVPVEDGCPAVTLEAKIKKFSFTMDLVPVFKIFEWPKPAMDWTCNWIKPKVIDGYKGKSQTVQEYDKYTFYRNNYVYAVPKIHHSEQKLPPEECSCFQISFGQIEKSILRHCIPVSQCCMKNVYKLLKQDLNEFYEDEKKIVCSFHIKHLLFVLMNEIEPSSYDQLRTCYLRGLEKLIEAIRDKKLPMLFLPEVNLLEKKFRDNENMKILKYFENKYKKYKK